MLTEFVAVDLETTGLDPHVDEITQVGAVRVRDGRIEECRVWLVSIEGTVPKEVQELTGITNELLREKGLPERQVLEELAAFCKESVLVMHNGKAFDGRFLRVRGSLCGVKLRQMCLDSLPLSRAVWPELPRHSLGALAGYLGIRNEKAHDAAQDAVTLAKICAVLLRKAKQRQIKAARFWIWEKRR